MRFIDSQLSLAATDLSNFLSCHYLTALEMGEAQGTRKRPVWDDPLLDLLAQRGLEHERAYVETIRATNKTIADLTYIQGRDERVGKTIEAMQSGADVIVQGALQNGKWFGRPDIIQRVSKPSRLGSWSYEVSDTKLARETRAGSILQLCLYSDLIAAAQGLKPEHFHVVTPNPDQPITSYRVDDYSAYFRLVRAQMEEAVARGEPALLADYYPEPVDHCDICGWSSECRHKRREDDHLSLVAGITRLQRRELESQKVKTLTELAKLSVPLPFKPKRGDPDSYARVRDQAHLQFDSRDKIPPLRQFREFDSGDGFCRLPEPCPGDVFLDLEGDPYAVEGGREYLFGVVTLDARGVPHYQGFWAFDDEQEKKAFEAVIDLIDVAIQKYPGAHVYHYAPYEPSAFKRLMGRHVTREKELDAMLRARRFVDLYAVVRQGLLAGVERYSIKNLEPFYAFKRDVSLEDARRGLRLMEHGLEINAPDTVSDDARKIVFGYNKDDCVSTLRLRNWLESLREELIKTGVEVSRPAKEDGEASEYVDEKAASVAALRASLLAGVPENPKDRNRKQQARWLMAYLLDWHRREDKAEWWEYYRLRELAEEDLLDEPQALAGLQHASRVEEARHKTSGKPTGIVVDRYNYPEQEMELGVGAELKLQDGTSFGQVVHFDRAVRTIDVRKTKKQRDVHPKAVFAFTFISSAVQEQALFEIGESLADDNAKASKNVTVNLLLGEPPCLGDAPFVARDGENASDFAVRAALNLDCSVLAIQGPPGAGKTFTGARMICALVGEGKKVAITATSHSVIRHLLHAVRKESQHLGKPVALGHKCDDDADDAAHWDIQCYSTNQDALAAFESNAIQVLGGTSWLWSRHDAAGLAHVLFIDEAGQMSLANALAVSRAAKNLVLLGDPQQLNQPQKGSHPPGVNVSVLKHILGNYQTIPPDRGIFLPLTWRLAPSICCYTSEVFYEGRLTSKTGLEKQTLIGTGHFDGNGLWVVPVDHAGNCNSCPEEVEVVASVVERLTSSGAAWLDENGIKSRIRAEDILIVCPYNAHVSRILERLGSTGVRVGTVDKFQGQQAPVVIYSTATSTPEDAPRGMEFLYSPNRLNVATSRAQCAAILVGNPKLFDPECRSPKQMKMANALCRFSELAHRTPISSAT